MTTTADLIAETRQHFLGGIREQKNKLAATIDTSETSLTFTYDLNGIKPGAVISIGLERMYVWASSTSATIVERAWDDTVAAAHTAGDVVTVNARADDFAVLRALNNELNALSSPQNGLFRVRTVNLTYNDSTYGYDLTSSGTVIGSPLKVSLEGTGAGEWTPLRPDEWVYDAAADTSDFTSGHSLTILTAGTSGLKAKVTYRAPFVSLATLADDVQAVSFLPATANDIPPMGAALQLAASRPMKRADTDSQSSSRRAEEVTTQDTLIAVRGLDSRRTDRIRDEASRLAADYPQVI